MFINCHSTYSTRYGTLPVDKLVHYASELGIRVLALTDINNTSGVFEFVQECIKHDITPLIGMEFRVDNKLLYVCLAKSQDGFREMNYFLSTHNLNKTPLPQHAPEFDNVATIYPTDNIPLQLKSNEYIGIRPADITKHYIKLQKKEFQKAVVLHPVTFINKAGRDLHLRLRAIDNNIVLTKLDGTMTGGKDEYLIEPHRIVQHFSNFPDIILNTQKLIESCECTIDFDTPKNKSTFSQSKNDDRELLHKLALDGVAYRYGKHHPEAMRRVLHELDVIDKLGFCSYFLIAWDIIHYSMARGFYHVGRGSGANSIVAYCMKITDVDPIELDLYFERFLNPKRTSPPDFDIDYSWDQRDEVYDYIFKRYGKDHTALLGTITTFKGRSIYRELGKVYGLPKNELDEMAGNPNFNFNRDSVTKEIFQFGHIMQGFPNHRSIHAGGVLITEDPIYNFSPLDLPPKGYPTVQLDMYETERIHLEKLDILSQRGIGHIKEAVDIVQTNQGKKIDIHDVKTFMQDKQVKTQLKSGDTIGCFYIESPAMRGLLNKLRCDTYLTLVAASSIIRPGVAKSGMMGEYIRRFHQPETIKYLHPVMEEQLQETFGVMVYQEDVIKICHHFAGLDLADSDVLRRAMSGKYRSKVEFQKIVDKFFANCKEMGYTDTLAKEVWRQIESFAGYSFSKAHSASYAVESFQSLYLKSHYPREFMVAVINNFGGFYRTWVYVHQLQKAGANVKLPCVNQSDWLTSITGKDAYLGLIHIQGLERKLAEKILLERLKNGKYQSLEDFINRTKIGQEQVITLIRVGALSFTGIDKKKLLWDAHSLMGSVKLQPDNDPLFKTYAKKFELPELTHMKIEDAYDEMELLNLPITMTQFEMVDQDKVPKTETIKAKDLMIDIGKEVSIKGSFVAPKSVRTVKGEMMAFGAFLDDEGEFFDTVHFPDSLKQFPLRGRGVYHITGKATEEFGYPSIEVSKMEKLAYISDPRF